MNQTLVAGRRRPNRARTSVVVALCFAAVFLSGAAPARPDAASADASHAWRLSEIGPAGDVSGLALDSGGGAHACWMSDGDLKYGTNVSGVWTSRTVDTPGTGFGGTYSSAIAVDHRNVVHIAYDGTQKLKYATNASGTWVVTTIDDPGFDVGDDVAIAVDSHDKVHVIYLDRQNGHLRYATDASGSWAVADLGAGGYIGTIAVDPSDNVHIVHNRFVGSAQMAYTTNASGGWVTTSLGAPASYHGSLKVDPSGHLHLSYFTNAVYYATDASGAWGSTLVDGDVGMAANSSLVLDSKGAAHITYGDYGNHDLKYATDASGAWIVSVVDGDGDKGYDSSLAIDAADELYATYTDRSAGTVRFATTAPPRPVRQFLLPTKITRKVNAKNPAKDVLTVSATLDTGPDAAAFDATAAFSVGGVSVPITGFAPDRKGVWRAGGAGFAFAITPGAAGGSRCRVTATLKGAQVLTVGADGAVDLTLSCGNVSAKGACTLKKGAFTLGHGALPADASVPVSAKATLLGAGRDSFAVKWVVAPSDAPTQMSDIVFALGPTYSKTIPGASFKRKKAVWSFSDKTNALPSMTIDTATGSITVTGKKADLGTFAVGAQSVRFVAGPADDPTVVDVRMVRKGKTLTY